MAAKLRSSLAVLFLLICSLAAAAGEGSGKTKKTLKRKQSTFCFYWHDQISGSEPTSVTVIQPAGNATAAASSTVFGLTHMIDNLLTEKPEPDSKELGRAQGLYASAACKQPMRLIMAQNFVFSTGKYKGSTLSVIGSNEVFSDTREMPVVGGTGLFRFANGYVQLKTHSFDPKSGDAIVKYTVNVMHY